MIIALMGVMPCAHINAKASEQFITIGLAGDVMLGRLVNEEISKRGYSYPWGDMLPYLHKNDLNIINLETTLTKSKKKVTKVFNFKADPDKVEVLKQGKISLVNIANNHILDFSEEGLRETIATLNKASIPHVGAGNNIDEAKEPKILMIKGLRIGVIGYTDNEPGWEAKKDKPGTNYIKVGDINQVKQDIKEIRNKVDILILTIQWGPNMREVPTKEFQDFAHQIIDAGVDIIHGHSAHVVQGIEIYKKKLILYDTGDFIDDYMVGPALRNDHTFLFRIAIKQGQLFSLTLVPAIISNMQVNLATGEDKNKMIARIKALSSSFGTKLMEHNGQLIVNF